MKVLLIEILKFFLRIIYAPIKLFKTKDRIVYLSRQSNDKSLDMRLLEKEIDEERNNAFVAVTRAKRWLYVTYPKQRMMPWKDLKFQQKSRFVREIE